MKFTFFEHWSYLICIIIGNLQLLPKVCYKIFLFSSFIRFYLQLILQSDTFVLSLWEPKLSSLQTFVLGLHFKSYNEISIDSQILWIHKLCQKEILLEFSLVGFHLNMIKFPFSLLFDQPPFFCVEEFDFNFQLFYFIKCSPWDIFLSGQLSFNYLYLLHQFDRICINKEWKGRRPNYKYGI